jgi:hypothetical protein
LGLQFDVGLTTPTPFSLTVVANNTTLSTELYFASTGQYGVQLIFSYSFTTETISMEVQSAFLNFYITVSPSTTVTYPVLDASGNTLYETTASTVMLVTALPTDPYIFISFATSPVSGYSLQVENFPTTSNVYITIPSTESYQQVSITDATSTTFYYCESESEATWQTSSCTTTTESVLLGLECSPHSP